MSKEVAVGKIKIGNNLPFVLIAGPCVIESEYLVLQTAEKIKQISDRLSIPFIFKSSFDKANRSSQESYRGVGVDVGLKILERVKRDYEIPVITDIHLPEQAKLVGDIVDVIQIPAFLCRQTDLLIAAAKTNKPVNVKKAQFLAPWDMKNVVDKIETNGNGNILLCERGTMFGYNNLVVDMTGMIEMKKMGYPVVFDVTHSVQKPSGNGKVSGGNREYVNELGKAGIALGVASLFMEVHPNPDEALSDGPNMIELDSLEKMLLKYREIDEIVKRR